ncbi:MAG: sulfatase [Myxococcota bacterium]|nr:sulfatase [Myxococcota bacterium]
MRDDTRIAGDLHPMLGIALALSCLVGCSDAGDSTDSPPAPLNIVLFVLDAARADHFGVYGYERATTPSIDAFAADAARFTHAIAEGSFTFASMSSLFSGLSPDRTGLLKARRLGDDLHLLPEVAREAGYRTRGYSENPYITPAFGFDRGFDDFDAVLAYQDFKRDTRNFEHTDASAGIEAMLDFMSEPSERPFFAYLHLLRPHNPYAPSADFAGRFGSHDGQRQGNTQRLLALDKRKRPPAPKQVDNLRALYDENLAEGDAMFGALFEGLASRGLLEDTLVIVLSDHGEAFLEHGRLLHGSTTFDEMIRIPLLIRIPGVSGSVVDHPVQLAGVGATLQQVLQGSQPPVALVRAGANDTGETLSWAMQHERRACLRNREHKLIVDTASLEVVGYYDLRADPLETTSLPLDEEGSRLLARIETRIRSGHASLAKPPASALEPKVLERLRALGYAEE